MILIHSPLVDKLLTRADDQEHDIELGTDADGVGDVLFGVIRSPLRTAKAQQNNACCRDHVHFSEHEEGISGNQRVQDHNG